MFSNNDMPVGFVMSLAQNEKALNYYSTLANYEKENIKNYIKGARTGEEAKMRIETTIQNLEKNIQ